MAMVTPLFPSHDNIIVIYDNQPASVQFVMEYKRVLTEEINSEQNIPRRNLKEVVFTQDGMPRVIDQMDSTRMNVLICLMGGQAAISFC